MRFPFCLFWGGLFLVHILVSTVRTFSYISFSFHGLVLYALGVLELSFLGCSVLAMPLSLLGFRNIQLRAVIVCQLLTVLDLPCHVLDIRCCLVVRCCTQLDVVWTRVSEEVNFRFFILAVPWPSRWLLCSTFVHTLVWVFLAWSWHKLSILGMKFSARGLVIFWP
jgi:hypothetical protein